MDNSIDPHVIVMQMIMLKMGLLPNLSSCNNVSKLLKQVDPSLAREMKRKFRKVWRRIAKRSKVRAVQLGLGDKDPSPECIHARKKILIEMVYSEAARIATPPTQEFPF